MCKDARGFFADPFSLSVGHQYGLSLTELLITLGLTATLSTVGLQSFQYQVAAAKADVVVGNLRTTLALARSEAITLDASVVLCRKTDNSVACAGSSSRGRPQWRQGWLLFQDVDEDRLYDADQGDI
ncbi:MAG: GspH/FimT family pseudopilin, partial [Motiliproteus sp.]